jgi:iron complex outermembrane receptor protein
VPVFGVLANGVAPGGPPTPFQLTGKLRARSYAGYAQGTFAVTDAFDVTLGARYTRDEKSQFSTAAGEPGKSFDYSNEEPTWLANVQYRPSDDKLVYLKYSTGYISGGFSAGPVVTDPVSGARIQGNSVEYAPEKAKSWEVGLKADWLDRRLRTNLAAFYVDYTNLQFPLFIPVDVAVPSGGSVTAFLSAIQNAGKSRAYGLEAEITALLVENLQIDLNAGYTNFDYKELDPGVGQVGVFREAYRPKFNANLALSYSFPELSGGVVPGVRLDASYRSPMNLTATVYNEDYNEFLNDLTRTNSQLILNARAKLSEIPVGGGVAEVAVWARNLTDNQSLRFVVDVGTAAGMFHEPATYGIDVTLSF